MKDYPAHYHAMLRSFAQRYCAAVIGVLCGMSATVVAADDADFSVLDDREQVLVVTARNAKQSGDKSFLHAVGDLNIRTSDWQITADSAYIYGSLNDPRRIAVRGDPAELLYLAPHNDEPIKATGIDLELDPDEDVLELNGAARVQRGNQQIVSHAITYLLKKNIYSTKPGSRVRVVTQPDKGEQAQ